MVGPLSSLSPLSSFGNLATGDAGSPKTGAAGLGGSQNSFAATLSDLAARTVTSLQDAERVSVQGLQGKADTRQVVDAVMSAEQSLQTAIAIRDKIVTAYLEVSRMAI